MFKWDDYKDILVELINIKKLPYEQIGEKFGCSGNNIKKVAKRLGIQLNQRRKINETETFGKGSGNKEICLYCGKEFGSPKYKNKLFCSQKCQSEYIHQEYIKRWLNGEETGLSGEYNISRHVRRYLLEKNQYSCEICGWSEKNKFTNTIPLEIHHIDGDYKNNKESNLQVLCPNCHSLTETFKGHNSNGRKGRNKYS